MDEPARHHRGSDGIGINRGVEAARHDVPDHITKKK
jgi:hypothetical protein